MIFALFLLVLFTGMIAFMQFGPGQNGMGDAKPQAQLFAENMAVWHQAAMLEVRDAAAGTAAPINCDVNSNYCAVAINDRLINMNSGALVPTGALAENWAEYRSIVPMGLPSGWQSFLIRNANATAPGVPVSDPPGNENYVLTVFRGYGGGTDANAVGKDRGNNSDASMSAGLASTVEERAGLGTLICNPSPNALCVFQRTASQDTALRFHVQIFLNDSTTRPYFNNTADPNAVLTALKGRPAMMTRVQN